MANLNGIESDACGAIFVALADPTRRKLFETLTRGPRSVGDLARTLPVSRPAVSQHLRHLSDAGLVQSTRKGTRNIYAARQEGVEVLRRYLESLWGDVLTAFADKIDQENLK
ncbi:metalloregulator ArsR/SmtB family transcription factor [Shimia sp.]|uniref:ArsR/SmtB family transcription factor n=1 Tax=Shimia sp. TaxID=1954381 RepID=UPI00329A5909